MEILSLPSGIGKTGEAGSCLSPEFFLDVDHKFNQHPGKTQAYAYECDHWSGHGLFLSLGGQVPMFAKLASVRSEMFLSRADPEEGSVLTEECSLPFAYFFLPLIVPAHC